jgi:hypothetical protein
VSVGRFFHYAYGLVMGTSVPYLKPVNRFLFKFDSKIIYQSGETKVELLSGGAGNVLLIKSAGEVLIVNTNLGPVARELAHQFKNWLAARSESGAATPRCRMVVQALTAEFAGGISFWDPFVSEYLYQSKDLSSEARAHRLQDFGIAPSKGREILETEKLQVGEIEVVLRPVERAVTGTDMIVDIESLGLRMFGPLFYRHLHPALRYRSEVSPRRWAQELESSQNLDWVKTAVPGEGVAGDARELDIFLNYIKTLSTDGVEFSNCRAQFDWPEIPSFTSLEENFDLLQVAGRQELP